MDAMYKETGRDSMKGNKKSKSVVPKNVNKNIKVSQSEINSIKKLGMKKALQIAAMNKGSEQAGAVASFGEGVRRLYGETRYQNALYTPKASPGPVGTPTTGYAPKRPIGTPTAGYAPKKATYQTGESSAKAKKPTPKAKNTAGFKPGSVGANVISSFKKAYLGK